MTLRHPNCFFRSSLCLHKVFYACFSSSISTPPHSTLATTVSLSDFTTYGYALVIMVLIRTVTAACLAAMSVSVSPRLIILYITTS